MLKNDNFLSPNLGDSFEWMKSLDKDRKNTVENCSNFHICLHNLLFTK